MTVVHELFVTEGDVVLVGVVPTTVHPFGISNKVDDAVIQERFDKVTEATGIDLFETGWENLSRFFSDTWLGFENVIVDPVASFTDPIIRGWNTWWNDLWGIINPPQ